MNWNLFLAFLPWLASSFITIKEVKSKLAHISLIVAWALFFPNAPYILTDLFHLTDIHSAPIWYDLILILSYSWSGLLYGFLSLMDIEELLKIYVKPSIVKYLSVSFLFLSCFGIYLGRFLRWNSWDLISAPFGLFNDVYDRFVDPTAHSRTWGLTILLGFLLNIMYLTFKAMRRK
jgi:uncharacterized membrane protein